jgi:hypothetical protein
MARGFPNTKNARIEQLCDKVTAMSHAVTDRNRNASEQIAPPAFDVLMSFSRFLPRFACVVCLQIA